MGQELSLEPNLLILNNTTPHPAAFFFLFYKQGQIKKKSIWGVPKKLHFSFYKIVRYSVIFFLPVFFGIKMSFLHEMMLIVDGRLTFFVRFT